MLELIPKKDYPKSGALKFVAGGFAALEEKTGKLIFTKDFIYPAKHKEASKNELQSFADEINKLTNMK